MFIIILNFILSNPLTSANIYNSNYNNDLTLLLSVYDVGICAVNIDDNQESDHNFNISYNVSSGLKSIDFNFKEKNLLWLENDVIKSANFHSQYDTQINTDKIDIIVESGVSAFSLDWTHDLVYYHDRHKRQIIAVNRTDTKKFKVIINKTKEIVGDIKTDPLRGLIYYSQWDDDGNKAQIIRANQDGTNQTDISQMVSLKKPISLAIDFVSKIVYFIDKELFIMGSIDKSGKYSIITKDKDLFYFSRSLDVLRNQFFWNFAKSVFSNHIYLNDFNSKYLRKPIRSQHYIDSIKILDPSRQPFVTNRCYNNNCSYLCIPSGSHNYRCVCPQIDNMTSKIYCKESINQLFNSSQTDGQQLSTTSELKEEFAYYDKLLWFSYSVIIIQSIALITVIITYIANIYRRRNIDSTNAEKLKNSENEEHKLALNSSHQDSTL